MDIKQFKAIDTTDESKCCGCMACMNVCQHQAISMIENEKGFIMPFVDINKCVDCGLCLNVCDFRKEHKNNSNIEHAYSLVANDTETLKESTSGGAFTVFSDVILSEGGIVIGAVMENDFTVRHILTTSFETRNRMRGSKYVQSDVSEIYKETRESLKKGQHVLFSGTPCQCAALRSYLGKDYDNLIVVDFLCHGVPNNKMFKEHIEYLNAYYRIPSVGFSFRNKTYGWDSYNNNNNNLSNGKTKIKWINQIYYNFFVSNLSLRPACHRCPYRSLHRPSDITIADFWGIEKLTGHKNRDGVSLVMTHSEKGLELVKKAMENCQVREYPSESVLFRIATAPSKPNAKCDIFWETYIEKGYNGVAKKFFINSRKNRVRFEVRKIAKKLRIG